MCLRQDESRPCVVEELSREDCRTRHRGREMAQDRNKEASVRGRWARRIRWIAAGEKRINLPEMTVKVGELDVRVPLGRPGDERAGFAGLKVLAKTGFSQNSHRHPRTGISGLASASMDRRGGSPARK